MDFVEKGVVQIPRGFFNRTAKKEYVYWGKALIREFLQNSVDAGAKNIHIKFIPEKLLLAVKDDGCGMDRNVIVNKLLALGGSQKHQNSIGGFGKAKELLFFAWEKYAIRTNNYLVFGSGAEYSIRKTDKFRKGTICVIKFNSKEEYQTALSYCVSYLPHNEVGANIYLNDRKIKYSFGAKRKVREFDWADIYCCDDLNTEVSVRVSGVEMFEHFSYGRNPVKNKTIIELKGNSYDILTTNRDALNYKYHKELQEFLENITINPISALTKFEEDICEIMLGIAPLIVPDDLLLSWGHKINNIKLGAENIKNSKYDFKTDYDFLIRRNKDFSEKEVEQFLQDPVAEPLAKLWTNIVFEIVIANKMPINCIRTGFMFSNNIKGLYDSSFIPTIYINPLNEDIRVNNIKLLIEAFKDVAYHELAHFHYRNHDEQFVLCAEDYRTAHRLWRQENFLEEIK